MTRFRLDASLCDDDFNLSSELFKRWDYDGDGTWDTRTSRSDRVGYTYADSGVFRPRLLVRDTGGLVDSVVGSAITVLGSCPTPDFAMVDGNPNSPTFGQSQRFWDYHGRRVVLWMAAPSK
jgi:PKD repeat protein